MTIRDWDQSTIISPEKTYKIFDIETDGLNPTKIHCLSYAIFKEGKDPVVRTTTSYDKMREFFKFPGVLVGHYIRLFDIPACINLLGIDIDTDYIDTLALSWYINPYRKTHGLEDYGVDFGVPKPVIEDWENQTIEEYIHRCEEDVKITYLVWEQHLTKLRKLYRGKDEFVSRCISYLMFKMDCVYLQVTEGWPLDEFTAKLNLELFEHELDKKVVELQKVLPKVPKYGTKKKPKSLYKKDGSLSSHGEKWFQLLEANGLPLDHEDTVEYVIKFEEPNPGSSKQIKDWLFHLGWKPATYKINDKGERVPQVKKGEGLCDSVLLLADKQEEVQILAGIGVLKHRVGILKGFLRDAENGRIKASLSGFTNTLRLKHATVVNLPGVKGTDDWSDGRYIRECLTASPGNVLCGSDVSSLEDTTKRHYIYPYDPEYVEEMMDPDFDAHLDIAQLAGFLTKEQVRAHKDKKEDHSKPRKLAKIVNFSSVYGVGAKTLARSSGLSQSAAKDLLQVYWKRNWAVKKVAEDQVIVFDDSGDMWLLNPLAKIFYSLRGDKDRFSTLNQGTGAYCFDTWLLFILQEYPHLQGQFHDELVIDHPEEMKDYIKDLLEASMDKVNKRLGLNSPLGIDVQFGETYADVH